MLRTRMKGASACAAARCFGAKATTTYQTSTPHPHAVTTKGDTAAAHTNRTTNRHKHTINGRAHDPPPPPVHVPSSPFSSLSPPAPADCLHSFWSATRAFMSDSMMIRQWTAMDTAPGALEARWTAEVLSTIHATMPAMGVTTPHRSTAVRLPSEHIRRVTHANTQQPAHVNMHRPNDAQLVQMADKYRLVAMNGPASISLAKYSLATQALIRLSIENPKRPKSNVNERRETHVIRTDPLFSVKLLNQYCNVVTADPALCAPPQLAWSITSVAIHALLGLPARTVVDGVDDRPKLLRMIVETLREKTLPPGGQVNGAQNVYEYAIRHETFFRAILFSALHCNDLSFAATIITLIPQVCVPSHDELDWSPISRRRQIELLQLYMTKCCAEIHHQAQVVAAETSTRKALSPNTAPSSSSSSSVSSSASPSSDVPPLDLNSVSHSILGVLSPGFVDLNQLSCTAQSLAPRPFDSRLSRRFATPLLTGGTPQSSPSLGDAAADQLNEDSSTLDLLMHGFRQIMAAGITPNITPYNFLLFGLTHAPTSEVDSNSNSLYLSSSRKEIQSLLHDCLNTISSERLAPYDHTSFLILLRYTLAHPHSESALMSWSLREARDMIKAWKKREWKSVATTTTQTSTTSTTHNGEAEKCCWDEQIAELMIHATICLTQTNDRRSIDRAINNLHEQIKPLLPNAYQARPLDSSSPLLGPSGLSLPVSRSPSSDWSQLIFHSLCLRGSVEGVEEFLDAHFEELAEADLAEAIEQATAHEKVPLYEMIEEWMSRIATRPNTGRDEGKTDAQLSSANTVVSDVRDGVSSSPSPSPSSSPLRVSGIFLKWQLAKSRLSAKTRFQLGLGPPSPTFNQNEIAHAHHGDAASIREAARYVIYHARKLHLEHTQVDAPLSHPSVYLPPDLSLPASVLGAPNFITGWVVILAGWFSQLGEANAFARIKGTLALVSQASGGSNKWNDKANAKATNAAASSNEAAAIPAATTQPPTPIEAEVDLTDEDESVKRDPSFIQKMTSAFSRWATRQKDQLLANPIESIHIFTPVPSSTPLLETRIAFGKLHPELLNSILYAYGALPHLHDLKSPHWLRVLTRLEPLLPIFDLEKQHPFLLKLFTLQSSSAEKYFLKVLCECPTRTLPSHMSHIARIWEPHRATHDLIRGRRLCVHLIRMAHADSGVSGGSRLREDDLKECLRPFINKMAARGSQQHKQGTHARTHGTHTHLSWPLCLSLSPLCCSLVVELRWWLNELARAYPKMYTNYLDSINTCVSVNGVTVSRLLKLKVPPTNSELEQRGHMQTAEARAWQQQITNKTTQTDSRLQPTT